MKREFYIALGISLLLGGCAQSSKTLNVVPKNETELIEIEIKEEVTPVFSSDYQTLATALDAYLVEESFNGVSLIASGDEIILFNSYGLANVDNQEPLTVDHQFQIASVSKSFVAVSILQLVEAGKLTLDQTIDKYFPDMPNADQITIHQLLIHTSGLYSGDDLTNYSEVTSVEEIISPAFQPSNLYYEEPGTYSIYSNLGYDVLGAIIEQVSGMPYEKYLEENILIPADMTQSGLNIEGNALEKLATAYNGNIEENYEAKVLHPSFGYSSGGLHSTAMDLYKYDRALKSNSLISQQSYDLMTQDIEPFTTEDLEQIEKVDGVASIEPVVTFTMKASLTDQETGIRSDLMMLTSIDETISEDYVTAGTLPKNNEVMLNSTTALGLFGTEDFESIIGKDISLTLQLTDENNLPTLLQQTYTVSGVYEMDSPMMTSMPMAFLTYDTIAKLYEDNGFELLPTQLNVIAESEDLTEDLKQTLFDMGYANSQTNQMLDMMLEMLDIMTTLFTGISCISLVVSGVMILVVLYISVIERTKEIGVLRAIGARKKDVKRIFIVESIGLGLLAGVVATGVAMLCQLVGNHLMTKAFGVGIIDLTAQYIAMGVIVSLVVSVIAGWFPARQAAKLDPVESLRYE